MSDEFIYLIPKRSNTKLEKLEQENCQLKNTCNKALKVIEDLSRLVELQNTELTEMRNILWSSYGSAKKPSKGRLEADVSVEVSPIRGFHFGARINRDYT